MDTVAVTVPLRPPTKKMKKRKELDALALPRAISRRTSGKRSSQELLTDSSDERSEYWNVSTRTSRKCRGRRSRACAGFLKACSAFLACASILATASLIWLFIDVRQQLSSLRMEMDQVIAGNEGVPDALQKCHSVSKNLQNNQTVIFSQLSDLKLQISNFTMQLTGIQHGLHQVQDWFQAAPELANVPKDLNALSNTVASFGSQIRDLGATINTLKETSTKVQDVQALLQKNVSSIKNTLTELLNSTQAPQQFTSNETKVKTDELNAAILLLTKNVNTVNETLSQGIKWAVEDQAKDHKKLVGLEDTIQKINAKVLSLDSECVKLSDQTTLVATVQKVTSEIKEIEIIHSDLTARLKQLEQSYELVKNSTTTMLSTIAEIQNEHQITEAKSNPGLVSDKLLSVVSRSPLDTENVMTKKVAAAKPKHLGIHPP